MDNPLAVIGIIVFSLGALLYTVVFATFLRLWTRAWLSNVPISLLALIGMGIRRTNASAIVDARIMAKKAGVDVPYSVLETHYLAGGNVTRVIHALVAAQAANVALTFEEAAAIDLAGHDVLEAVKKASLANEMRLSVVPPGVALEEGALLRVVQVRSQYVLAEVVSAEEVGVLEGAGAQEVDTQEEV